MSRGSDRRLVGLGLLLIVAGTIVAILGNAWQGRVSAGVERDAVASERIGTPVSVRPEGGEDLRVFLGESVLAGDRVLDRVVCGTTTAIETPARSGKGRVTKLDRWSLYGTVKDADEPFEVRCTTQDPGLRFLDVVVTTGGGGAGFAVFPVVGGIIAACMGGGLLLGGAIRATARRRAARRRRR